MRTQIIAELASNHGGDLALACDLISAAADAGADWVKVQAYRPSRLRKGDPQTEWLTQAALSGDALAQVKKHADDRGVKFLASVFDRYSAWAVRSLGCSAVKLGSGEVTRDALWRDLEVFGFSTVFYGCGLSTEIRAPWHGSVIEQTCIPMFGISQYPAPELRATTMLKRMAVRSPLPWGWSDHGYTLKTCQEAMEWGAAYVERHLAFPDRGRCQDWDSHPTAFKTLRRYAEACAWEGTEAHSAARSQFVGRWKEEA